MPTEVPMTNLMQQLQHQISHTKTEQHSPLLYKTESPIHHEHLNDIVHYNNNNNNDKNIHNNNNNNNNNLYDNDNDHDEQINSNNNNNNLKFMQKYRQTHLHQHQTQTQQQMQQHQQISSPTCQQQQQQHQLQQRQEIIQHQIHQQQHQHHQQQHQIPEAHQTQHQMMAQQLIHLIPSSTTQEPISPMRVITTQQTSTTTSNGLLPTATSVITTTSQAMNQINQLHQHGQQQQTIIHLPNKHNNNEAQHQSPPTSPYTTYGLRELVEDHNICVKTERLEHQQKFFNFDISHEHQQSQSQQQQQDLETESHEHEIFCLHANAHQRLNEFERKFDREIIVKME